MTEQRNVVLVKVSIAHLSVGIDDEVTVVAEQVGAGVDVVRVFRVAVRRDVSVVDANLKHKQILKMQLSTTRYHMRLFFLRIEYFSRTDFTIDSIRSFSTLGTEF